ncbi:MAG: hypothetical protein LUE65_12595 [Clostridiales bacterium]|nr:hypothetical protein [Clostridiales bacterium]
MLSKTLKRDGNYRKGGATGFDTSINRLQAQGYVIISNFIYLQDRHGKEYGWGVAEISQVTYLPMPNNMEIVNVLLYLPVL